MHGCLRCNWYCRRRFWPLFTACAHHGWKTLFSLVRLLLLFWNRWWGGRRNTQCEFWKPRKANCGLILGLGTRVTGFGLSFGFDGSDGFVTQRGGLSSGWDCFPRMKMVCVCCFAHSPCRCHHVALVFESAPFFATAFDAVEVDTIGLGASGFCSLKLFPVDGDVVTESKGGRCLRVLVLSLFT